MSGAVFLLALYALIAWTGTALCVCVCVTVRSE
jgi:hypothetical protein